MQDLTFGEQVKIVLSRKNMTIKELAKKIEIRTKKKMSRQNLTQRLGRDNFQEQDMRMIAEILGCPFHLNILDDSISAEKAEAGAEVRTEVQTEAKAGMKKSGTEAGDSITEEQPAETAEASETAKEAETEKTAGGKNETSEKEAEAAAAKESEEKESSDAGAAHERDITIGELVEIHKELDAIEMAAGKLPESEGHDMEKPEESAGRESQEALPAQADKNEQAENPDLGESERDITMESGEEPVENLLEEIEAIEKEEKKEEKQEPQEEKAHGWRAYFMQKLKKHVKEPANNKSGQAAQNEAAEEISHTETKEQAYPDRGYKGAYPEEDCAGQGYPATGYMEGSYMESGYMEGQPEEAGRLEGGYYMEGQSEEAYDNEYTKEYELEYQEREYSRQPCSEEAYIEELPQEEEKGERNPYTGKEYESNSVRMHPTRIGYVQVYDRASHEWTDMTEWAFLGYQERKKQLLGKDYDPPIYLD